MSTTRRSGILLHPTSLPGPQPVGTLGRAAYEFIDFLAASGQTIWQILPLGPLGFGDCPYSALSAFAGEPLLIDLPLLVDVGDLLQEELPAETPIDNTADYAEARKRQLPLLKKAWQRFTATPSSSRYSDYEAFCSNQAGWLDDYALFEAIRHDRQADWLQWPEDIRQRQSEALEDWVEHLKDEIAWHKYLQFVLFEQWFQLKAYANGKGVKIFGDMPIFVALNSVDVWANRSLFFLDENDRPSLVAGVPPDYFSETGQRWGNPLYRWDRMTQDGFSWWLARFRWNLQLFDLIRVDHFRGFSACWAIPAEEETAVNGSWQPAPGHQLLTALQKEFTHLPIVAEDLGVITEDVEELRDRFALPGMKILQFAFDSGPDNPYLPHNHPPHAVVYTGTHDNATSLGWWQELSEEAKRQVRDYLRRPCEDMPWPLIETALASVSSTAIIPLQDLLCLDDRARMNHPGVAQGNWRWRLENTDFLRQITERLRHLTHLYGRSLCIRAETHEKAH